LCSGQAAPHYEKTTGFRRIPLLSRIPGVDWLRKWWLNAPIVPLNNNPNTQLQVGHEHIMHVNAMCSDFLYLHNAYLWNACNIVVFNEMFFSQTDPLTEQQLDFINDKILELSQASAHTLFYPNFLYTQDRNLSGNQIYALLGAMRTNMGGTLVNININSVNDCEDEIMNTRRVLRDTAIHNQTLLVNKTNAISNGEIVTEYQKPSYWNESNDTIGNGALYEFGTGVDVAVPGAPAGLAATLTRNISTEICFDLANGVRSGNGWDNGTGASRLHILQSNQLIHLLMCRLMII
jgi:hypothetical protein